MAGVGDSQVDSKDRRTHGDAVIERLYSYTHLKSGKILLYHFTPQETQLPVTGACSQSGSQFSTNNNTNLR